MMVGTRWFTTPNGRAHIKEYGGARREAKAWCKPQHLNTGNTFGKKSNPTSPAGGTVQPAITSLLCRRTLLTGRHICITCPVAFHGPKRADGHHHYSVRCLYDKQPGKPRRRVPHSPDHFRCRSDLELGFTFPTPANGQNTQKHFRGSHSLQADSTLSDQGDHIPFYVGALSFSGSTPRSWVRTPFKGITPQLGRITTAAGYTADGHRTQSHPRRRLGVWYPVEAARTYWQLPRAPRI